MLATQLPRSPSPRALWAGAWAEGVRHPARVAAFHALHATMTDVRGTTEANLPPSWFVLVLPLRSPRAGRELPLSSGSLLVLRISQVSAQHGRA